MSVKRHTKLIHEGDLAAEVEVELITTDDAWSPYLSLQDAERLDEVREALRRGDLREAGKVARIFRLVPLSA